MRAEILKKLKMVNKREETDSLVSEIGDITTDYMDIKKKQ